MCCKFGEKGHIAKNAPEKKKQFGKSGGNQFKKNVTIVGKLDIRNFTQKRRHNRLKIKNIKLIFQMTARNMFRDARLLI